MIKLDTLINQLPPENTNSLSTPIQSVNVSEIMIMATPDINNWIISGDLILTSFFGLNVNQQIKLVKDLAKYHAAGIMVKKNGYLQEISSKLIKRCQELKLPLLEIRNITYRQIIDTFTSLKYANLQSRNKLIDARLGKSLVAIIHKTFNQRDISNIRMALSTNKTDLVRIITTVTQELALNQLKILISTIKDLIPNVAFGFLDDNLIIAAKNGQELTNALNKISSDLPIIRLILSSPQKLVNLQDAYQQTNHMRKLVQADNLKSPLVEYDRLGINKLFLTIPSNLLKKSLNVNRLEALQNQNPELFNSLFFYFQANQNVTQAAKKLFIHPKSLTYRLHKIEKILAVDLNNPNDSLSLNLASRFLKLQQAHFFI